MTIKAIISGLLFCLYGATVVAGPYTDQLSTCLSDSTSGKERKLLAKWVFIGMAAHPEIQHLTKMTDKDKEDAYQEAGTLYTRLLTENCNQQIRNVIQHEDANAIQGAFSHLGQLAMQELMMNQEVNNSFMAIGKYIDKEKMQAALPVK